MTRPMLPVIKQYPLNSFTLVLLILVFKQIFLHNKLISPFYVVYPMVQPPMCLTIPLPTASLFLHILYVPHPACISQCLYLTFPVVHLHPHPSYMNNMTSLWETLSKVYRNDFAMFNLNIS